MAPTAPHKQYILKVTAGATYDTTKHSTVPVNTEKPIQISSENLDATVTVRIQNYRGLPKSSPPTSNYFSHPSHSNDLYSITFSFTPKTPINGDDLVFGNDFDHPIRDRLPPLFDTAFGIVKRFIDPGLDGDVYGDEPYLYGAVLSSINILNVEESSTSSNPTSDDDANATTTTSDKTPETEAQGGEEKKEENPDSSLQVFTEHTAPLSTTSSSTSAQTIPTTPSDRQKHFLTPANRSAITFSPTQTYNCDFFNTYLDFNKFALKLGYMLPPFSILGHWDGKEALRTHSLRYVLKNRAENKELLVVIFSLIPVDQVPAGDDNDDSSSSGDVGADGGDKDRGGEGKEVGADMDDVD